MFYQNKSNNIPSGIISKLSSMFSHYFSETRIILMFKSADISLKNNTGKNKADKSSNLFDFCNENKENPIECLGHILEYYMEKNNRDDGFYPIKGSWDDLENKTINILNEYGYQYISPGKIVESNFVDGSIKSLYYYIKEGNYSYIKEDFDRALLNIKEDPPASLTAACTIIETVCKVYLEENNIEIPKTKDVKRLWNCVANNLGFEPKNYKDEDLKKILSGLFSIVDGIGSLRTHAGSAHGHTIMRMNIEKRHARLAIHAAHTLVMFLLETWDRRKKA